MVNTTQVQLEKFEHANVIDFGRQIVKLATGDWEKMSPHGYTGSGLFMEDFDLEQVVLPIVLLSIVFFCCRIAMKKMFGTFGSILGIKSKTAIGKFGYQMWLLLFYLSSAVYGWYTIRGEKYTQFPPTNRTKVADMWLDFRQNPMPDYQWYFVFVNAFYWSELIAVFIEPKRSDFAEYVLHHTVTLTLILLSLGSGEYKFGCTIIFYHDVSDVFLGFAKSAHYIRMKKISDVAFGGFVLTFIFFRLICFPMMIALFVHALQFRPMTGTIAFTTVFLSVLLSLHLFWFTLIVKMIRRLLSGTAGDCRSDDEGEEKPARRSKKEASKKE